MNSEYNPQDPLDHLADQFDKELDQAIDDLDAMIDEGLGLKQSPASPSSTPTPTHQPSIEKANKDYFTKAPLAFQQNSSEIVAKVSRAGGNPVANIASEKIPSPSLPSTIRITVFPKPDEPHPSGIDIDYLPTMYAMHHHIGFPSINWLSITNKQRRRTSYQNVIVKVRGESSRYIGEWSDTVGTIRHGQSWEIQNIRLPLVNEKIQTVKENVTDSIIIEAFDQGQMIASRSVDVTIAPYNHWPFVENQAWDLSAFIWPNQDAIQSIITRAGELQKKRFGTAHFEGYQSYGANQYDPTERVIQQLSSLHDVLNPSDIGLQYINPPASYDNGQKIRTPNQVMGDKHGTCLDLALLLAGLIEQVGLHPLLVLTMAPESAGGGGHAFAGCWLHPGYLLNQRSIDFADENVLEIFHKQPITLFNSTNLTYEDPQFNSFEAAELTGQALSAKSREEKSFEIIDIMRCRQDGIMPMPPL